ncbi:MAG: hypothetical protein ACOC9P_01350 [bacterium]
MTLIRATQRDSIHPFKTSRARMAISPLLASWGALLLTLGGAQTSHAQDSELHLESRFMELTVQPDFGARASRIYSKPHDYEFVVNWSPDEEAGTVRGGGFAGIMLGTFTSDREPEGQLNQSYELIEHDSRSARLRWRQDAALFSDLLEQRTITLSDEEPEARLEIEVTNRAEEPRFLAYRFQDWTGTGEAGGFESVYINPQRDDAPHAYMWPQDHPPSGHKFYLHPEEHWFGRVDLPRYTGLVVEVEGADVTSFMQYFSRDARSKMRTAEIYFPITRLAPGESWQTTLTYRVFNPSEPEATLEPGLARFLETERIRSLLKDAAYDRARASLPLGAQMRILGDDAPMRLLPAHPTDADLGTQRVQHYAGTLRRMRLAGTPGEVVPFAFNAIATRAMDELTLSFSDLTHAETGESISHDRIEPRFVSADGYGYLLNDWALSRDVPEQIGQIGNDVRDADELTAFSLSVDETAPLWATLRVPSDAAAGRYATEARLATPDGEVASFEIELTVHPFELREPTEKVYGSFFRHRLAPEGDPSPGQATRASLRAALENVDDMGYRALVVYLSGDEALWLMDQCAEMGWENATFVLIGGFGLDPDELEKRYAKQNFTILGWTVDEPRYKGRGDIERAVQRYERRLDQGLRPTYTPNSPFALMFSEILKEYVPILVTSVPHFIDITRRYDQQGRDIYWYSAGLSDPENASRIQKRLVRGVYLWKEPVNGIIDWGEDAHHPRKSYSSVAGFAGREIVHRTGRENVRQALIDMRYLYTLEQELQHAPGPVREEAEALLSWVRTTFSDNPSHEAVMLGDLTSLDFIRQEVARMLTTIQASR